MNSTLANVPLADLLDGHTHAADSLLVRTEGERTRCLACGHRCLIAEGQRGICKVRFRQDGELRVPFGYVAGLQCDPVEKKPFFHVLPGSDALTFGMMGCDLHCAYCQNWLTSQALRDASAVAPVRPVTATQLVDLARRENARLVVSSYNEPLITAEWAVAVFREAKAAGLACAFVSNGNATPEALDFLRPWIVAYKVDLKSFNDRNYRKLGTTLSNVLDTIRLVHERGLWLEIVTLVIPGFNDSPDELRGIARFLASVDRDIPWHVTAFHKDYRMTDPDATPAETLTRAAEMGVEEGLRFVYAGNLPGRVGPWENTNCPGCHTPVIERIGYLVCAYRLTPEGRCLSCDTQVPGVWPKSAAEVRTGNDREAYLSRLPRRVDTLSPTRERGTEPNPSLARRAQESGRSELPMVQSAREGRNAPMIDEGTATMASPSTRPRLSAEEKQQAAHAAGAMLRAVVRGEPAAFPVESPSQVREHVVCGAFVSLKRGRHLRSCCGAMGQQMALYVALEHAVDRTAWEDERFPPISPSELPYLDMEVWLLYAPERVEARGPDRAQAVTIGKHGIKVIRGQASALFLPSVAVESEWDAQHFLDRVCVKAGLPATAWRDDATALFTFEGESLRFPLAVLEGMQAHEGNALYQPNELARLIELCRGNLAAHLVGAVPRPFSGVTDGTVNGIVLSLQVGSPATGGGARHFTRMSLRPGLPLQTTLFSLVQTAAQHLAAAGIGPEMIDTMSMDLLILHDPVLHGSVADPHLDGVVADRRAFLVMERNKTGLTFDPAQEVNDLVRITAGQARVSDPESAVVFSLEATTNAVKVDLSMAPQPVAGPANRPSAVAGTFYPSDPAALSRMVDELLQGEARAEAVTAAMVPHAGLKYSGRVAADVLKRVRIPSTVIILGPKHTSYGVEWAVAPHQRWAIPGGTIASDDALARRLCAAIPGLEMDAAAHQQEHGIEVELPLLARLAPQAKVVGIALGYGNVERCRQFATGLAEVIRGLPKRPLLLISTDMNHFANDAETRRLDELALAALEKGDAEELHETVTENSISMCGVVPAMIVLETLRLLDAPRRATRVAYATTADVSGDPSRVVGYAGMLFGS